MATSGKLLFTRAQAKENAAVRFVPERRRNRQRNSQNHCSPQGGLYIDTLYEIGGNLMKRRLLASILAFVIVLGMLSTAALATGKNAGSETVVEQGDVPSGVEKKSDGTY